jgi:hypothetical protein
MGYYLNVLTAGLFDIGHVDNELTLGIFWEFFEIPPILHPPLVRHTDILAIGNFSTHCTTKSRPTAAYHNPTTPLATKSRPTAHPLPSSAGVSPVLSGT